MICIRCEMLEDWRSQPKGWLRQYNRHLHSSFRGINGLLGQHKAEKRMRKQADFMRQFRTIVPVSKTETKAD